MSLKGKGHISLLSDSNLFIRHINLSDTIGTSLIKSTLQVLD